MSPRFRDGIGVSGSRNGTFDPDFCDYAYTLTRKGHNSQVLVQDMSEASIIITIQLDSHFSYLVISHRQDKNYDKFQLICHLSWTK